MPANAFIGKAEPPGESELAATLGSAKKAWDQFLGELAQEHQVDILEWKCHSPKWGWSLRAKRKKRTIAWLAPADGCFTVAFILGGKAMQAARESQLPEAIIKALDAAPKYPEGTGLRLVVKSPSDIGALMELAAIKLAN